MLLWAPAAHGTGLGADWSTRVRATPAGLGMVVALALATGALGWWAFAAAACTAVAVLACAVLAMRKIGGVTGDVLGAAEQLGETFTLLFAAVLVQQGAAFPFWT
jgi:adenosylcobinamide-GDP ribazoletransferase